MTLLDHTRAESPPPDTEDLFKEAKRRRRRRRLAWLGVILILVAAVAGFLSAATSPPRRSSPQVRRTPIARSVKPTALPTGTIVPLQHAGALAVGPTGVLYVFDEAKYEVLARLSNGQFDVVAGDGENGYSGDDGMATKARLSDVTAMAFSPNGDLYLADSGRVRVIDRDGTIRTIAGDGDRIRLVDSHGKIVPKPSMANGMSGLSAPLGPEVSLAFSPSGELYLATQTHLLRLLSDGHLRFVRAVVSSGSAKGTMTDFGQLAVDSHGDIYVSGYTGWSIYKVAPDGVATDLGYARRSGGNTAVIERGPGDVIEADDGPNLFRIVGDRLVTDYAINKVPGINTFEFMDYFALASNGVLYADNLGPPAFEPYQQVISVADGRSVALWKGVARISSP